MLINPTYGAGGEPTEPDILANGLRFSGVEPITDVLTGGEKYEPQSE